LIEVSRGGQSPVPSTMTGIAAAPLNYAPPDSKGDDHQRNDSFTPEADNRADGAFDPEQKSVPPERCNATTPAAFIEN